MKIKGLIGRKKDIFEYVFKPFSEYYIATPCDDGVTYDILFRYNADYELRVDREIEEVRITIKGHTVILNTSDFLKIEIL